MCRRPGTVAEFLAELRRRIPVDDAWWRRALAEVEDHLRLSAEELADAGGEQEAVARFGSVEEVLAGLASEYAAALSARTGRRLVGAAVLTAAVALASYNGPFLTGHLPDPWLSLADFLLTQFAYGFAALAVACLGVRPTAGLAAGRWAVAFFVTAILVKVAWALSAGPLAHHRLLPGLLALLALAVAVGVPFMAQARRLARVEPWLRAAGGPLPPLIRRFERPFHPVAAVLVALAGAAAFQLGSMPDGVWPALRRASGLGPLGAGLALAACEILAVLVGLRMASHLLGTPRRTA